MDVKLKITKSDLRNARDYLNTGHCLVCTAVRRQFKLSKNARVSASASFVRFQNKCFTFDRTAICDAYNLSENCPSIRPDVKPFTLELTNV